MKERSLKKDILFGIIISFLIVSLIELSLRYAPFSQFLSPQWTADELVDHAVFWQPLAHKKNPLRVYRHWKKYRGKTVSSKQQHEKRILIFGGSHVYGWPYTPGQKVFSDIAEIVLKQRTAQNINIINCGEGGFSSFQGLLYLKKEIDVLEPDIVIFCFGANDGATNQHINSALTDKEFWHTIQKQSQRTYVLAIHKTLQKFYLYNALKWVIFRIRCSFSPVKQRVPPEDFKDNIAEFMSLGNKYNYIPVCMSVAHKNKDANKEYRAIYKKMPVNFIDMHVLLDTCVKDRGSLFVDDMHLNADGHACVGKLLAEQLIYQGVLNK